MTSKRVATFGQKKQIDNYLQAVALQFDLAGKALGYKDGHSDETVAKFVGDSISPATVGRIRSMEYGCSLRTSNTLSARVTALEREVKALSDHLHTALDERVN